MLQDYFKDIFQGISDCPRKLTIFWQPLPILSKVLILIPFTIMIPFLFALTFSILLASFFVISGFLLFFRWAEMIGADSDRLNKGHDMKVTTFYSIKNDEGIALGLYFLFPIVGVIFGGIHCRMVLHLSLE